MRKEEKICDSGSYCFHSLGTDVYHVGDSKIRLFSSLEGFITEKTCFNLSKVETERILLPEPVYEKERYVGGATPWKEVDWIHAFFASGSQLKQDLEKIERDIELLTSLGYDLVEMPYYCSNYDAKQLTFDGTIRIKESDTDKEALDVKNRFLYQEYLKSLVYNAMSEFDISQKAVLRYLSNEGDTSKRLKKVLHGRKCAGYLIRHDIANFRK